MISDKKGRQWHSTCTTWYSTYTTRKAAYLLGFGTVGQVGRPKTRFLLHNFFKKLFSLKSVTYEFSAFFQTVNIEKLEFAVPLCPAAYFLKPNAFAFKKWPDVCAGWKGFSVWKDCPPSVVRRTASGRPQVADREH
jgi:hypothetical protein